MSKPLAEEKILADLFLQRMRIGERRFAATTRLRRCGPPETALIAVPRARVRQAPPFPARSSDYYAPAGG